ncbi:MAG: DUF2442 domain-containing protein [Planctomycetota bacterium]|nr:DUF2442 domain-containing protein [Planctomycetota bacterium]
MGSVHKVADVKVLQGYRLDLTFDDGKRGVVSLSHLVGKGVFSAWTDYSVFKGVRIGAAGELVWGEQVDLCPDALYLRATHQSPEEVFPSLRREHARA